MVPAQLTAGREQAVAYRLAAMHLHERLPARSEAEAAGACGIADVPGGWGGRTGLAARVEDAGARDLASPYAMRGTPHVVPPADVAVFTTALLAADDDELRPQLGRGAQHLDEAGLEPLEAYRQVAAAVAETVAASELDINAFHAGLRERLPDSLLPWCRGCESHHVHAMFWRLTGYAGVLARGGSTGRGSALAALAPTPATEPDAAAGAELVRRFLRCYGPATPGLLAEWAGIGSAQARRLWALVADELVPVRLEKGKTWILEADVGALEAPPAARGARVLGPNDPYLLQRDRNTLYPDPEVRKRVRRPIGSPGVILVDGAMAAIWRPALKARVLEVKVEPLDAVPRAARKAIEAELAAHAPVRDRDRAEVTWM